MRRARTLGCLAAAAMLLSACTLGPEHQRPEVALPGAYAGAEAADAALLSTDWWTLFNDAELNRLVAAALERNRDIAQAVARVEQAEALLREAGALRWPQVDLHAGGTRLRSSGTTFGTALPDGAEGNDFRLALSTSFELDFWGRLRRADEAARAQALATRYARDTVRLTIAGLTAQSWFALRSLDGQIAATAETLKTRDDSLRLQRLRLQAGNISRLDVDQSEILRVEAAVQLRELQRQRALTASQLGVLTGQPGLTLTGAPLLAEMPLPVPPPGLPSRLLERRPDVQQAEQSLAAASALVGVARAAQFPTLTLTGIYGGQSAELGDVLDSPSRIWSLGLNLVTPLFDAGRLAAQYDAAEARQREAIAAYQATAERAFRDVADALADLEAARSGRADLQIRADATTSALKLAQARYDAGYSGFLELLEAQRSAQSARIDLVRNRQAQLAASVALMQSLGGGWQAQQ
jgi:multidrug efflux system outer membrane protein